MTDREFIRSTPEQLEVFLDLQKLMVKYHEAWPDQTAIAVFGSAMGSICAILEIQYKLHREKCDECAKNEPEDPDFYGTFTENYTHYYTSELEEALRRENRAADMVDAFFLKTREK